jgi:glycosyltransferase involved in cell wall biosynthesis
VVGAVGRLVPGKRFDVLVEAVAGLPAELAAGRPVRLLLVGEGPERTALEGRAAALGVADRLLCTGERTDVPELLTAMDVLAAPSVQETFGLAVLEGLAAGLPVCHSGCPALEELPVEAAPGARKLPSDAASYRSALLDLAARPERALPPPPAVAHYDIVRTAAQLGELYQRLGRRTESAPAGRES